MPIKIEELIGDHQFEDMKFYWTGESPSFKMNAVVFISNTHLTFKHD